MEITIECIVIYKFKIVRYFDKEVVSIITLFRVKLLSLVYRINHSIRTVTLFRYL